MDQVRNDGLPIPDEVKPTAISFILYQHAGSGESGHNPGVDEGTGHYQALHPKNEFLQHLQRQFGHQPDVPMQSPSFHPANVPASFRKSDLASPSPANRRHVGLPGRL